MVIDVDALANEIRRVDGGHSLGAGALAEALMPFIESALEPQGQALPVARLHVTETDSFLDAKIEVLNGENMQPEHSPIDLYLAPLITSQLALPAGPVPSDAAHVQAARKALAELREAVEGCANALQEGEGFDEAWEKVTEAEKQAHTWLVMDAGNVAARLSAIKNKQDTLSPAVAQPVAVIRFEHKVPGKENEMPRVISCNWLPDGEYQVFLSAEVAQPVGDEQIHSMFIEWYAMTQIVPVWSKDTGVPADEWLGDIVEGKLMRADQPCRDRFGEWCNEGDYLQWQTRELFSRFKVAVELARASQRPAGEVGKS